ncbi:MAG TPA: cupredoxin family copper-binding protein [Xanthomonadales bacterium]|nr:cupredoxin family copper-binding protein [Xanthomonadales bacterium]
MRRLVLSFVVALALGGGVALAQYPDPSTPAPATTAAPAPAPSPVSTIHIKNFAYVPDTVTIHPGATVRFVEDDETPHTVTATDHSYDSGNLNQKDRWSHTFAKEGTYTYFCAYHPYMKGTVVVK